MILKINTLIYYVIKVGYTYETPKTPYIDELRMMRGILIKSQLCVEKEYLSWWLYEEIMWKYYEGIDQLTSIHKEDINLSLLYNLFCNTPN